MELTLRQIPFQSQVELPINYKGKVLSKQYVVDFIVYDLILVEIKALSALTSREEAQLLNYLKASSYKLGLLINFGEKSLSSKRMINTPEVAA